MSKKIFEKTIQEKYNISEELFDAIVYSSKVVDVSNKKMIRISDENIKELEPFIQDLRSINHKVSLPKVVNAIVEFHLKPKKE
ncbi:hypothetical protein NWE55_16850 (plasmid) [Myroides albus]|uniref:Uncharacterized protein n=1 Tax=Myroides odoratimimus TaxID=76832 RepID=A0AAI8C9K3_9FLAO|nr:MULTISPECIES: hypothetical protein [Myroides]ALU28492.1 hypothetical protein AS202_20145 [Myroides odoratimimus]UVD81341.1 hypothetical protein NWE55_16850 [Myroides albus]